MNDELTGDYLFLCKSYSGLGSSVSPLKPVYVCIQVLTKSMDILNDKLFLSPSKSVSLTGKAHCRPNNQYVYFNQVRHFSKQFQDPLNEGH